jgi:hypothetical protein
VKYIVFETKGRLPRSFPIIFPDDLTHADVAKALLSVCPELAKAFVAGAGFLSCTDLHSVECHGESESLKVKSRGAKDDAAFIMRDYTHGIL